MFDLFWFCITPFIILPSISLVLVLFIASVTEDSFSVFALLSGSKFELPQVHAIINDAFRDIIIILGLLVTSSFIVLQMFAANFVPHTISLFFQSRYLFYTLAFVLVAGLYCVAVSVMLVHEIYTFPAILVCLLRYYALAVTIPYFSFLVHFLNPDTLILEIQTNAISLLQTDNRNVTVKQSHKIQPEFTIASNIFIEATSKQEEFMDKIELLGDIGLSSLKQKDKENANNALFALYSIVSQFLRLKQKYSTANWFIISPQVRRRPDFSSLSDEAIQKLSSQRVWVEWKIFHVFQLIFESALKIQMPSICLLSVFYTRKLVEQAVLEMDEAVFNLGNRFMNTFVRFLIDNRDIRSLSAVLHEYRELSCQILKVGNNARASYSNQEEKEKKDSGSILFANRGFASQGKRVSSISKEARNWSFRKSGIYLKPEKPNDETLCRKQSKFCDNAVYRIACYWRYYFTKCLENKLDIIAEIISQDLRKIIGEAFSTNCPTHQDILNVLLTLDDATAQKEINSNTLKGIRMSQIHLAADYLSWGEDSIANQIFQDMKETPLEVLHEIYRDTMNIDKREYWEISTRMKNMGFLNPKKKVLLEKKFFPLFTQHNCEDILNLETDFEFKNEVQAAKCLAVSFQGREIGKKVNDTEAPSLKTDSKFNQMFAELNYRMVFLLFASIGLWFLIVFARPESKLTSQHGYYVMSNLALATVLLYSLMCITSVIILQVAANRFKVQSNILFFFRDSVLYSILICTIGTYLMICISEIWVHQDFVPKNNFKIVVGLSGLNVVFVLAYFVRFFKVLQSDRVLSIIIERTFEFVAQACDSENSEVMSSELNQLQYETQNSMKIITDFAFACISQHDQENIFAAVSSLKSLLGKYHEVKDRLPNSWHQIGPKLIQTCDFIVLSATRQRHVQTFRIWFEFKILNQYGAIFDECTNARKYDVCQFIVVDLRHVGLDMIARKDITAFQLLLTFFNTFLRRCISMNLEVLAVALTQQYVYLAECVALKRNDAWDDEITNIATYLKYYSSQIAGNLSIYASVIHALVQVCEVTFLSGSLASFDVLELILQDRKSIKENNAVIQPLIRLATVYLIHGNNACANIIAKYVSKFNPETVLNAFEEVCSSDRAEFWEIGAHGIVVEYLTIEQAGFLPEFLNLVTTPFPAALIQKVHHKSVVSKKLLETSRKQSVVVSKRHTEFATNHCDVSATSTEDDSDQEQGSNDASPVLVTSLFHNGIGVVVQSFSISLVTVSLLVVLTLSIDGDQTLRSFSDGLLEEKSDTTQLVSGLSLEMVCRLFTVVVMCTLIALQKLPSRTMGHITMLYQKSFIGTIWILLTLTALLSIWKLLYLSSHTPAVALVLIMLTAISLVSVFQYFSEFFMFLDEGIILQKVIVLNFGMLKKKFKADQFLQCIGRVTDFSSCLIQQNDSTNSSKYITALSNLALQVSQEKSKLPDSYFRIFEDQADISNSFDFSNLSESFKDHLIEEKIWMEWKILRQFYSLYKEAMGHSSDIGYRITIATLQFAQAACKRRDFSTLDLSIRFVNTFLKEALVTFDIRLVFNILFQYRQFAEHLIDRSSPFIEAYALDIACYFKSYSQLGSKLGIHFVAELIAHDLSMLCMTAALKDSKCQEPLFKIFLGLYRDDYPQSHFGVRKSQIKLAAFYMRLSGKDSFVENLFQHMKDEEPELLVNAFKSLCAKDVSSTFWEVNERMYNIDTMSSDDKALAFEFLKRFPQHLQGLAARKSTIITKPKIQQVGTTKKDDLQIQLTLGSFNRSISKQALQESCFFNVHNASGYDLMRNSNGSDSVVSPHKNPPDDSIGKSTEKKELMRLNTVMFLAIFALSLFSIFLFQGILDYLIDGKTIFVVSHTPDDIIRISRNLGKSAGMILCIALTPTLIVLQINSKHLLTPLAQQFFGDRKVYFMFCTFSSIAIYFIVIFYCASQGVVLKYSPVVGCALVCLDIILLFPYFTSLFQFLNPARVVRRIIQTTLECIRKCSSSRNVSVQIISSAQDSVNQTMQQLGCFAGATIVAKDKYNVESVIRSMSFFIQEYLKMKNTLPKEWFDATRKNISTSKEFISMDFQQLSLITEEMNWVETKLLRQFHSLFTDSISSMQEGCLLIAIESFKLGELAISRRDDRLIKSVMNIFNTYLRTCLSQKATRTIYNVLNQYKQLAELLVVSSGENPQYLEHAVTVAKYLRYYAGVAFDTNQIFVLEIIANDITSICETSYLFGNDNLVCSDKIMSILMSLFHLLKDGEMGPVQEDSICRCCLKLATLYIYGESLARAQTVMNIIAQFCSLPIIEEACSTIQATTTQAFWEVNDRGGNFNYLHCDRRNRIVDAKLMLPLKQQSGYQFGSHSSVNGTRSRKSSSLNIPILSRYVDIPTLTSDSDGVLPTAFQKANRRGSAMNIHSIMSTTESSSLSSNSPGMGQMWRNAIYGVPGTLMVIVGLCTAGILVTSPVPFKMLLSDDYARASDSLSAVSVIMVTFLNAIVTVSTIVLQIASNRYTPQISLLFLKNRFIACSLLLFFGSTIFIQIQSSSMSELECSKAGYILSLLLTLLCFSVMFPYIALLFNFLNTSKIFREILDDGLQSALTDFTEQKIESGEADRIQRNAIQTVELVSEFTVQALRVKDKYSSFQGIDLVCGFLVQYMDGKKKLKSNELNLWIGEGVAQDIDFAGLSSSTLTDLESQLNWIEWKGLRQLQKMFEVASVSFGDAVVGITRSVRYIAQCALENEDQSSWDLTIKFFNTFIQHAIVTGNEKVADSVSMQYSLLLRFAFNHAAFYDLVQYHIHYSNLAVNRLQYGSADRILADLRTVAIECLERNDSEKFEFIYHQLVNFVVDFPDVDTVEDVPRIFLRMIIKFAASLCKLSPNAAGMIFEKLKLLNSKLLKRLQSDFRFLSQKDQWEISERGETDSEHVEELEFFFAKFRI